MTVPETSGAIDLSKGAAGIRKMFDAIAPRYDLLNHLLSAGIDRIWRKRAVAALSLTGRDRVLDLCTGTGDLAIAAGTARPPAARVVGVDFAEAMLRVGAKKVSRRRLAPPVTLVRGDATRIPIADESVDAVTVAFGIRNVEDVGAAYDEIYRVLKPGGRIAILEFSLPRVRAARAVYLWYANRILPRIGRVLSGHDAAYAYLPASVQAFPPPEHVARALGEHAFEAVKAVPLTFGIVYLYTGRRGDGPAGRRANGPPTAILS